MKIFLGLLIGALIVMFIILFYNVYMYVKNNNTSNKRELIIDAIYLYNLEHYDNRISYDYMEDYETTLYRLWDWGCTNIVPKHIYVKIKPYIKRIE